MIGACKKAIKDIENIKSLVTKNMNFNSVGYLVDIYKLRWKNEEKVRTRKC